MGVVACPPNTPPTHGVVTFDPAAFKVLYPEFSPVADAALSYNFQLAQFILDNRCASIVVDANKRDTLFQPLVAHITALLNGANGQPPAGIVGRVNNATEGAVS